MNDIFNSTNNFSTLSIEDLLTARDTFHYQLMTKKNVLASAIGYFLIRKADKWPSKSDPNPDNSAHKNMERTLENSEVRPESWPCVLVFVEQWENEEDLANVNPADVVPRTLYLENGRSVPVCVVSAKKEALVNDEVDESKVVFPRNILSGGFPLISYSQNVKHIASLGCLVTDGHLVYALTNKHVLGKEGEPVYSKLAGEELRIGVSSAKQLGRVAFTDVYNEWKVNKTWLNMDIGLIEVDDLNQWKSEVFQVGTMGRMADLSVGNLSLRVIGQKLSGYGAVSGPVEGEIKALFYRFKALGGFEYVSDFLIGSRNAQPLNVHHGDSGTVLLYERTDERTGELLERMPLAVLWGQQVLSSPDSTGKSPYALASCLSTACDLMGVDLVRDFNLDQPNIWGKVGHYTVGHFAIDGIPDAGFRKLMRANVRNISFDLDGITADFDSKDPATKARYDKLFAHYCPLADVPDIIWKNGKSKTGGRYPEENLNHYLDADIPCTKWGNKTFLQYVNKPALLTVQNVKDYYANLNQDKIGWAKDGSGKLINGNVNQGILPLRVWQAFDYMVAALKEKKPAIDKFLMAAGALAHYVGDACQPLHSSYKSDGDPTEWEIVAYTAKRDSPAGSKTPHAKGDVYDKAVNPGTGTHVAYEDTMIDAKRDALIKALQGLFAKKKGGVFAEPVVAIADGQSAGYALVELMGKTQKTLDPGRIVSSFKAHKGKSDASEQMWTDVGADTVICIARGCLYQAAIWQAAWKAGGRKGSDFTDAFDTDAFRGKLKKLYDKTSEFKSYTLATVGGVLGLS